MTAIEICLRCGRTDFDGWKFFCNGEIITG